MDDQAMTHQKLIEEISALRRRIIELEDTEARYRKLFERSSDAIFLVEKSTGRYLDGNIAAEKLVGLPLSELKSQTTHNISPRNATERLHKVSSTDETLNFGEVVYVRPDGTKRETMLHTVSLDEKTVFGIAHDITELKQTEKALTFLAQCGTAPGDDFFQSLARYLSETTEMDFVCIDRLDGDQLSARTLVLYVDGKFEDNLSYAPHETPCRQVAEKTFYCFPENVRNMFPHNEVFQAMVAESCIGTTLVSHTGQPIGLITLVGRRPLADPQPVKSLLNLVAIRAAGELERKQYEEDLKASKAFIETALNSLTDSLYVIRTADFTILGANKAFTDVVGLGVNSIIGKHCYELTHRRSAPCDHPNDPCPLMETLKTGQPSTMEHIHFDSTAGERFVEVSAFPIRDERGEIQRIVHVDRDITERKKMAETLKKSEGRLRLIYEKSPIALGFIDQDGILVDCNDALSAIIGSPKEKLIGCNMKEDIRDQPLRAAITHAFSGSMGTFEGKYKTVPIGNTLYLKAFFVPVFDENGVLQGVQYLAEDITERKQYEEELLKYSKTLKKLVRERTAELAMRNENLQEMNTALHVLLQKREEDKRKVEELIVSNIKSLVYPYLEKMQNHSPNAKQHLLISIIETHLNELLSPLLKNIQQFNLTPKEIQVAAMVKDGKITKEIAEVLGVETSSIDAHRNSIRKKLGLSRNVNLQSKLQSLM